MSAPGVDGVELAVLSNRVEGAYEEGECVCLIEDVIN